ncbi:MAG TPA: M28 family metallopeptidase [Nocardioidaceae bacterium]|nr:M28 family metallopeptidase [Nocardioidaceae bacterium]
MSPTPRPLSRRWLRAGVALGATAFVSLAALPADAGPNHANNTSSKLRAAVTPEGVAEHLKTFDAIADANGGTRASGTPGYAASVDYVKSELEKAGYHPVVQEFEFPFFRELSPARLSQVSPVAKDYATPDDFVTMSFSGSGDVTAPVVAVDTEFAPPTKETPVTSGCEADDFGPEVDGAIALIQRGGCTFGAKALNAQAAGAVGVVIFNSGAPGATDAFAGTLGTTDVTLPVVGTSFALGRELDGTTARIVTDTESETRDTYNVLAQTAKGDPGNVVMVGAHLDSVVKGPGVNDNGTGSAALLEIAEHLGKVTPTNQVRFAWWGAEESGLLGSEHYVTGLDEDALGAIALYLNFDMIGSPNYVRFVYDGDNSRYGTDVAAEGPTGSGAIEQLFHNYFASQDLPSEETPFSGRSDYGPFIAEGVPSGGLFTGAEGVKTAAQAAVYGGQAGVAYDHCYHQACDGIGNVNMKAVDEMSDAVAHAVVTYAMSTRDVNGSGKGHPVAPPGQAVTGQPTGTGTSSGGGLHDGHEELTR